MPSFGKIVGVDLEICRDPLTHARTHGGYFTAPFGLQPGTNKNTYISKALSILSGKNI